MSSLDLNPELPATTRTSGSRETLEDYTLRYAPLSFRRWGPGVVAVTAQTAQAGALPFWSLLAFISINLGVMNLLPIPGLDGGHAIFTFWEMISGRKVSDRVLEAAQYVGLIIILFLLLYANGNDVYRFFIK